MEHKENTLVPVWNKFPEVFSTQTDREENEAMNLVDLIASFVFTGDFYYYVIEVASQQLSNQHHNLLKVHGLSQLPSHIQNVVDLVHPDDIAYVLRAEEEANRFILQKGIQHIQSLKSCYCFRMRVADGSYRLFHHQSIALSIDDSYRTVRSLNIHTDISHLTTMNNHVLTIMGINGRSDFHQISLSGKLLKHQSHVALTFRVLEMLRYIAKGYSSTEAAQAVGIAVNTARVHRKNLLRKMGCHSVATLVQKGIELGLI